MQFTFKQLLLHNLLIRSEMESNTMFESNLFLVYKQMNND